MTNEELVTRIRADIDPADHMLALWQQNRGYIGKLAARYSAYAELEDLKQEGYIGLCEAVDHYDPGKGIPFIQYAGFWIKQAMVRHIDNCGSVIRFPSGLRGLVVKYRRIVREYQSRCGEKPSDQELCRQLDVSPKRLWEIERIIRTGQTKSLDEPLKDDEELTLGDTVSDGNGTEDTAIEVEFQKELKEVLWPMVDGLEGSQPAILHHRYQDGMEITAIAEELGETPGHVRTEERNALRALRRPRYSRQLLPFLTERQVTAAYHGNSIYAFDRTWTSSTERAALLEM